ncbi:hypothetical protein R3W88_033788 [Solanum pinnatisectum]|uniref:YTH domain-containing family protein n=1 Tax=Solanum pinnatisectum TaxID=50273 RepID=A0AAV9K0H2_9SOLN|nr:hypothetical protein R3W88_033788 [Solanum pinnatisectum]
METTAPSVDHILIISSCSFTGIETADLLQKLSLDSQKKLEITEPKRKPFVDSKDVGNGQTQTMDRSVTPLFPYFMDLTVCYVPNGYTSISYYYEDYSRYVNLDGVEMFGAYGDNGSLMYHLGYSYAAYNPYSPATYPIPTVGHDGQLYGAQHYHYPYFQPLPPTSTLYATSVNASKGEITTCEAANQAPLSNSSLNTNGSFGRGAFPRGVASSYQDPRFGFDGVRSPMTCLDGSMFTDGQARPVAGNSITPLFSNGSVVPSSKNQNVHPNIMHPRPSSGFNTTNGYMNRLYPNKYYGGQYGNTFSFDMGFGSFTTQTVVIGTHSNRPVGESLILIS